MYGLVVMPESHYTVVDNYTMGGSPPTLRMAASSALASLGIDLEVALERRPLVRLDLPRFAVLEECFLERRVFRGFLVVVLRAVLFFPPRWFIYTMP